MLDTSLSDLSKTFMHIFTSGIHAFIISSKFLPDSKRALIGQFYGPFSTVRLAMFENTSYDF